MALAKASVLSKDLPARGSTSWRESHIRGERESAAATGCEISDGTCMAPRQNSRRVSMRITSCRAYFLQPIETGSLDDLAGTSGEAVRPPQIFQAKPIKRPSKMQDVEPSS